MVIAPIAASNWPRSRPLRIDFDFRHGDQLELPLQPFGDPAPKVHADAGNRSVRVHIPERRHVIDGDAERRDGRLFGLGRLGANRARHQHDKPGAQDNPDKEIAKNRPEAMGKTTDDPFSTAGNHERSVKWLFGKEARVKSPAIMNVSCHRGWRRFCGLMSQVSSTHIGLEQPANPRAL